MSFQERPMQALDLINILWLTNHIENILKVQLTLQYLWFEDDDLSAEYLLPFIVANTSEHMIGV